MHLCSAWIGLAVAGLVGACSGNPEDTPSAATELSATTAPQPSDAAAPAGGSAAAESGTVLAGLTGDAAKGKVVFAKCQACHSLEPGQNRIGPSLAGIVGRTAGTVPGFNYSPANRDSGIAWTDERLFQFLERPQQFMPGTKMIFAGLPKPQDRADVIAHIRASGG